ncbi:MAG TPA: septum formation initiator family protein [Candidatus Moranbacteria bacterium]|nr:septum formation initiator family protein [Candidatus Moranbacteria bacterium]
MKNKNLTGSWIIWPIIFIAVIFLGFLGYSAYREFSKNKQVESEIELLKKQAEKIKQENMSLEERIAYLGSEDYQKIQAKDKLDLQDPGENVVAITQDSIVAKQKEEGLNTENNNPIQYSNQKSSIFLKWWNYFFAKK